MKTLLVCSSLMFGITSCATVSPVATQALSCVSTAVQAQINATGGLIAQVTAILTNTNGQPGWQAELDNLLVAAGPAAICAVQAVVAALEKGQVPVVAGAAVASVPPGAVLVGAMRGNAWLASGSHYALVK